MEKLPIEILNKEIGKYLDIPNMISMSFVCKDFEEIYRSHFRKIVREIDPYIEDGNIHDFLRITRVGTLESIVYKTWRVIFLTIIRELEQIYPYLSRKFILDTFYQMVPMDAIQSIKNQIERFLKSSNIFIIFLGVLYRNPFSSAHVELPEAFETDINDMIDSLLHEFSASDRSIERDSSYESLSSDLTEFTDDIIEYFPYENISEAIETWIKYL
jgi:hypothetical protein